MGKYHDRQYPGESAEYRSARDALLTAEIELRRQVEAVAAQRRALPFGGKLKEDYLFTDASLGGSGAQVKFSDLFEDGKSSLLAYSFMYGPNAQVPCPLCTSMLDGLNGNDPHIRQRINVAIIAKTSPDKIRAFAESRGWNNLRLLSSGGTTYNSDYQGELSDDMQMPLANVFTKRSDGIYHTYGSELLYGPDEEDQGARHIDSMWPLWNVFDLTPEGRGTDWLPKIKYD